MTEKPQSYSPLSLAFLGDAEYSLLVRKMLLSSANRSVGDLHRLAVRYVCAAAQAKGAAAILPILTEREAAIYKRGRNAHTSHTPKGASAAEYGAATGVEALLGYLSLSGEAERINELFGIIIKAIEQ